VSDQKPTPAPQKPDGWKEAVKPDFWPKVLESLDKMKQVQKEVTKK
jgi:hypothetical protein